MRKTSDVVKQRIKEDGGPSYASDNTQIFRRRR